MEFTHTRQQCFLAGRYLGMNWPEAHKNPHANEKDLTTECAGSSDNRACLGRPKAYECFLLPAGLTAQTGPANLREFRCEP